MKRILIAALFALLATPAFAVCPATLQIKDNLGVTPNAVFIDDGSGNCIPRVKDVDAIAAINAGVWVPGSAPTANVIGQGVVGSGATGGLARSIINCDQHVFLHITTATDTLITQGVTGQTVYVCGATAQAAGTATFFLENTASTNANCSSANTQIAGLTTMAANGQYGFYNPVWGGLKNTAANGLCVNSTGTGGFDLDVWFAKF